MTLDFGWCPWEIYLSLMIMNEPMDCEYVSYISYKKSILMSGGIGGDWVLLHMFLDWELVSLSFGTWECDEQESRLTI